MSLKISFAYLSDPGKVRKNNEDNALVAEELGLGIVADGMGGHSCGEVASDLAVKVTKEKFESMKATGMKPSHYDDKLSLETNQLGFAVQLANSVVYEAGNASPDKKGMGTTLSALMLNAGRLCVAHIGDSRIYLLRGGELTQMTEDHSLVMDHVRKGRMTKEQAEKSPLQNILTRALGTQKQPPIDLSETEAKEGDRVLLCSDGLFKPVPEDKIKELMLAEPDDARLCAKLVETANINGGPDNITVIAGTLKKKSFKESLGDLLK
jgi:protein phosphatase